MDKIGEKNPRCELFSYAGNGLIITMQEFNKVNAENDKYGLVNLEGKTIIPCKYSDIGYFEDNLSIVRISRLSGVINTRGEEIIPCKYDFLAYKNGVFIAKKSLNKILLDKKGEMLSKCEYRDIWYFYDGLAAVQSIDTELWGFIDNTGKEIVPCKYKNIHNFHNGLAVVQDADTKLWGAIDTSGKVIASFKYLHIKDFENGLARALDKNKMWGIINSYGQELTPFKYLEITHSDKTFKVVDENMKYGFVNSEGKEFVPCKYKSVGIFSENYAYVQDAKTKLFGFININGEEVIPCKYQSVDIFRDGLAAVKDSNTQLWGYINASGEEVIQCKYKSVTTFYNGLASVSLNKDETYFIDTNGEKLPLPDYYYIHQSNGTELLSIYNKVDNTCGYMDRDGNIVIPCKYHTIRLAEPLISVIDANDKVGRLDKNGKEIIPCIYECIRSVSDGILLAFDDNDYGYALDIKGRILYSDNPNFVISNDISLSTDENIKEETTIEEVYTETQDEIKEKSETPGQMTTNDSSYLDSEDDVQEYSLDEPDKKDNSQSLEVDSDVEHSEILEQTLDTQEQVLKPYKPKNHLLKCEDYVVYDGDLISTYNSVIRLFDKDIVITSKTEEELRVKKRQILLLIKESLLDDILSFEGDILSDEYDSHLK